MLPIDWRQDVDSIWFPPVFTKLAYCEHPTKCCDSVFPRRMRAMFVEVKHPGAFLLKRYQQLLWSRVALCSYFVFIYFLCFCFGWKKEKKKKQNGWSDEVAWKQCIIPSFARCHSRWYLFTLGTLHQKLCSSYLGSHSLPLNYMQISPWIQNGERREERRSSVIFSPVPLHFLPLCLLLYLPLCLCLLWCVSMLRPELTPTVCQATAC